MEGVSGQTLPGTVEVSSTGSPRNGSQDESVVPRSLEPKKRITPLSDDSAFSPSSASKPSRNPPDSVIQTVEKPGVLSGISANLKNMGVKSAGWFKKEKSGTLEAMDEEGQDAVKKVSSLPNFKNIGDQLREDFSGFGPSGTVAKLGPARQVRQHDLRKNTIRELELRIIEQEVAQAEQNIKKGWLWCWLLGIMSHSWFDGFIGLVVLSNALMMVVESEMSAVNPEMKEHRVWRTMDYIFLAIFSLELFMRLYVFGFKSMKSLANALDMSIVVSGWITEIIIPVFLDSASMDLKSLQGLKTLRVLRCVRCLRMLTIFKDLWLIVQSFFHCLKPLCWMVVFIMVIIFIFTMFATELIGKGDDFQDIEEVKFFRSALPGMLVMFQIMTLDEWLVTLMPFIQRQAWTGVFFMVYVCVSALALMNLVTAIVVETSIKKTREDTDFQQQMFQRDVQRSVEDFQELKNILDPGDSDEIGIREFCEAAKHHPALINIVKDLDMNTTNGIHEIFKQLDLDGSGTLQVQELMHGLLDLQALTKSTEKLAVIAQATNMQEKVFHMQRYLSQSPERTSDSVRALGQRMERLEDTLHKIEKVIARVKCPGAPRTTDGGTAIESKTLEGSGRYSGLTERSSFGPQDDSTTPCILGQ